MSIVSRILISVTASLVVDGIKKSIKVVEKIKIKNNNIMDKIQQMQVLCAKIGVFFANCDGVYESREKQFIENYLVELEQDGNMSLEVKEKIHNCIENVESLDAIILMTRDLLDGFNEAEQSEIKKILAEFITKLIEADGEIHPNELANYNIWKEQIGLE